MRGLVNSGIYKFLIIINLSCSTIQNPIKNIDETEYPKIISEVLKYHKKNGYWVDFPFNVRQCLYIDTMSCMYYKCNLHYYYLYINTEVMPSFKSIDKSKTYDFKAIQKLVDKEWKLSLDISDYSIPVQILTSKDKFYYGKENQYSRWPEGTFLFSPLIPKREKDNFSIWMEISTDRDPEFYEFYIRKKGDSYEVYGHDWDDYCSWGYDKDYIKELK